jgi:hypothetical protein
MIVMSVIVLNLVEKSQPDHERNVALMCVMTAACSILHP